MTIRSFAHVNGERMTGTAASDSKVEVLSANQLQQIAGWRSRSDVHGGFPHEEIGLLGKSGALAAPLPVKFGGIGLGTSPAGALPAMHLLADFGRANLSLARLYEGHVNALKLVVRYGLPRQLERVRADIAEGFMFAIWNTEGPTGVRLTPGRNGYTLSGKKLFASGVGYLRRAIVTASLPDDSIVLVHAEIDPEVQPFSHNDWHLQGMKATATGEIDLTGIDISPDAVIGGKGDYTREPDFSAGAWRTLAGQYGAMDALFSLFLADLQATGRGAHPIQRARLAEISVACETSCLWVEACAAKIEEGIEPAQAAIAYVNLARSAILRAAEEVITRVQRGIGAKAFLASNPIEQIIRDLSFYLRQPAPDQTLDEAAAFMLNPG